MKRFVFLAVLSAFAGSCILPAQGHLLRSPSGNITATIAFDDSLSFALECEGRPVLKATRIAMELAGGEILGADPRLRSQKETRVSDSILAPLSTKFSFIRDEYNLLRLRFRGDYGVEFRVSDDGFAYRFYLERPVFVDVVHEVMDLDFGESTGVWFPEEESLISHYERTYLQGWLDTIDDGRFCSLPVLMEPAGGPHVLVTESDLDDYPNLFLRKMGKNGFESLFPPHVLKAGPMEGSEDRNQVIIEEADYIARTTGLRSFPWRVFIIGDESELIESTLTYRLASPPEMEDPSWIKPGQIAWDWYNANNIFGVDFESGLNTETYKYFIDFASEKGIEYVILDEGWSLSTTDITESNPAINLPELIAYGKDRGVGIILWVLWGPLDTGVDSILTVYEEWGAAGIKVDFMQRADQYMVNYYERVARSAASRELLVDFHGAYKPTGLHRTWPNVLTFEGLKGNENNKWSRDIHPDHNLTLPFIRMAAGPMDYTPGAMVNKQLVNHNISFQRPEGMGTRCHEMAKYVVYESPLQMLCESPSRLEREEECTEFITRIPVTWDETRVMKARVGDYLLMGRRKGETWYVAAMTDWTPRNLTLELDFLGEGPYRADIMQDGANARRFAEDYRLVTGLELDAESKMEIRLAPGGGWVAIISPA